MKLEKLWHQRPQKSSLFYIHEEKKTESGAENEYLSNEFLDNLDDLYMFLNEKVTFTFLNYSIFFASFSTVAQ